MKKRPTRTQMMVFASNWFDKNGRKNGVNAAIRAKYPNDYQLITNVRFWGK